MTTLGFAVARQWAGVYDPRTKVIATATPPLAPTKVAFAPTPTQVFVKGKPLKSCLKSSDNFINQAGGRHPIKRVVFRLANELPSDHSDCDSDCDASSSSSDESSTISESFFGNDSTIYIPGVNRSRARVAHTTSARDIQEWAWSSATSSLDTSSSGESVSNSVTNDGLRTRSNFGAMSRGMFIQPDQTQVEARTPSAGPTFPAALPLLNEENESKDGPAFKIRPSYFEELRLRIHHPYLFIPWLTRSAWLATATGIPDDITAPVSLQETEIVPTLEYDRKPTANTKRTHDDIEMDVLDAYKAQRTVGGAASYNKFR